MAAKKIELDDTDFKIIYELRKDARATFQEIGETVGMTRPAVRERILRMEDAGVITGYHVSTSQDEMGRPLHVMISFKFNSDAVYNREKPNSIIMPILRSCASIECFWQTYGDLDFLIEASFQTQDELNSFADKLRNYGFVRSHIVVSTDRSQY